MYGLLQDLRYALRRARQTPVFSAIVVVTLALGIGVNAAVFSVADRALLRALPYPEADRLVGVWQTIRLNKVRIPLSYSQLGDLAQVRNQLDGLAPYQTRRFNIAGEGEPLELAGVVASADLFRVLGITPRLGRVFTPAEERDRVALLGYRTWVTRWGADPGVVGRQLTIENQSYTILGVLPPEVAFPSEAEQLWVPIGFAFAADPGLETGRERSAFRVVARLAPGATLARLNTMLGAAAPPPAPGASDARLTTGYVAGLLSDEATGRMRPALLVLLGAALLVLITASANAAALLIARATGRQREIALRQVLGGGPLRIARQLLFENLVLALLAGVVGGLLAQWVLDLLGGSWPDALPRVGAFDSPIRTMAFTFLLSLVTGVGFGLLPALRAVRPALEPALRAGGAGTIGGRQRRRALGALVAGQLALSLVLLVGAVLLLQSLLRLGAVDPGYDPTHLLAARVRLTPERYPGRPSQEAFFDALQARLAALPAVAHVSLSSTLPLSGSSNLTLLDPREIRPDDPESMLLVGRVTVGEGYSSALRARMVAGRGFTRGDDASAPRVVVVSQALARRLWPGRNALGERLPLGGKVGARVEATVIGIAADQRYGRLDGDPDPAMYLPWRQGQDEIAEMWLLLRTTGDPVSLAGAVRGVVRSLDPSQPIGELVSMSEVVSRSTASHRFNTLLVSLFAALALGLAMVGIAGVTAYSLSQRTREMGIRMALGAERGDLFRLGFSEVTRLVAVGTALGLCAAFASARTLRAMLFGVGPSDPATYLGVTLLLAGAALAACYLPIHRATKADPMVTLRSE